MRYNQPGDQAEVYNLVQDQGVGEEMDELVSDLENNVYDPHNK